MLGQIGQIMNWYSCNIYQAYKPVSLFSCLNIFKRSSMEWVVFMVWVQ